MKIMISKLFLKSAGLLLVLLSFGVTAYSQESKPTQPEHAGLDVETLKQANNPMSSKKSFNIQNYIISSLYGMEDVSMNQLMLRYAQPVGNIFLRATMPVVTESMPNSSPTTGFGDFSVFAIYKIPGLAEGISLGAGPLLVAPTGTHELGQGKWQTGLSAMAFFAQSHIIQSGALIQWQTSIAGDEDRPDVSVLTPQIFFMWQVGGGTYLRSTGVWSFDLRNGNYNVPIGLGIGKVIKSGGVVFNIFAEPQFSVLAQGIGQSKFQTFAGFNIQF